MSPEESHFLSDIEAEPDNLDRRLVYADWLEERSDPRGEFIQIWHEMHSDSLKPWTERYLELFRRRQVLRPDIDEDWLTRLGYFHQHSPLFTEQPPDRAAFWRLLEMFLAVWDRPLDEADRYSNSEVQDAEQRLGMEFPDALREWYSHSGRAALWQQGDMPLLAPQDTSINSEHGDLKFIDGKVPEALRVDECSQDDPPVYWITGPSISYMTTAPSVTQFVLGRAWAIILNGDTGCSTWRANLEHPISMTDFAIKTTALESEIQMEHGENQDLLVRQLPMAGRYSVNVAALSGAAADSIVSQLPTTEYRPAD